jgi:hypothetical protein
MRLLLVLASLCVALVLAGPVSSAPAAPQALAKTCSSGWQHAVIGGEHRCLRRGQFCAVRYDRTYHRYGYHCHSGRLR